MILLLLFSSDRTAIHIGNGEAMLRMLVVSWLCVLTMCLSANVFCLAVECFPLSARSRGVSFFTTLDWLSATAAVCALMNGQSNQMFLHVRDWMLAYTLLTICVTILMVLYVPETAGECNCSVL